MKTTSPLKRLHSRRGYTLIELGLVMVLGLMIAGMIMAMISQQFAFLKIFRSQNFLTEEAPIINNQIARIVGQADRFRVYRTKADAMAGTNAVMTGGTAVALYFRQPDGTMLLGVISFDTVGTSKALYYSTVPRTGATVAPDWAISKRPTAVTFSIDQGILRTTLTGPSAEQITYSGTMQQ